MKYYFICYEIPYRSVGSDAVLHIFKKCSNVINTHPFEWVKNITFEAVLISWQEITKEEYEMWGVI